MNKQELKMALENKIFQLERILENIPTASDRFFHGQIAISNLYIALSNIK
jgi:hypothetical protein